MNLARTALILLVGLLLVAAPVDARKKKDTVVETIVLPDEGHIAKLQEQGMPIELDGEIVRLELGGVLMQVRPLDEAARLTFYQLRSQLPLDPFPPLDIFPEGFTVFELSFLNNSSEEFQFLPGMASIVKGHRGGTEEIFIVNVGGLHTYFRTIFDKDPELMEKAMEVVHFQTLYLAPGERATKLLVFEGLSPRVDEFGLNIDFLFVGSESQDIMIPFRTEKKVRPRRIERVRR